MLAIILSVIVISLSGVMMPGPMFAVAVAKSYNSPWAGTKMSLGHAVIEVPIILLIYYGFARFFQHNAVQIVLSLIGGMVIIWLGINMFHGRDCDDGHQPVHLFVVGCRRCDAGDENYSLRRCLAAGDDCRALAVRPGLADAGVRPDLPH